MYARRIVITGLGAVTPLGLNVESFWRELVAGRSGVARIQNFNVGDFRPDYAAEVKEFSPEAAGISRRKAKYMGRHAQLALAAAIEANADAKLNDAMPAIERARIGTMLGVGMLSPLAPDVARVGHAFGAMKELKLGEANTRATNENAVNADEPLSEDNGEAFDMALFGRVGAPQMFPLWLLRHIPNLTGGHLSIELDTQAALNTITNGCVSAASAIGEAARVIARGDSDVMFAGGADARINPVAMLRYRDLNLLATKETHESHCVSAPFDEAACGFVNGEGAGILLLEDENHARRRGAKIHAELVSYAAANDAHDVLHAHAEGRGLARAIARCLKQADVAPDEIDIVFAPANGVKNFDRACANGLKTVFARNAKKPLITATRSVVGHTHAASSALDAIAAVKSLENGLLPPTKNLQCPLIEANEFEFVRDAAREVKTKFALVAAYGFGGHAAAILLRSYKA
ncbi:MAG: beta-ketoacyl-ACP synthase II [Pyrinomonadaceae bacterium]